MKKIVIFLIILSVAFGTWISLSLALVPANYILGYSVYENETLFSICSYDYGAYLKKSDKNGIISSHRLKRQGGEYKNVVACNERVYTLALTDSDAVVDEYDLNGGYIGEKLRFSKSERGIKYCYLAQYYQHKDNESPKVVTDAVFVTENGVVIYTLDKDKEPERISYDINSVTDIVWAQRGWSGLYFSSVEGNYFLLSGEKVYPLDFGEGFVPFNPMLSSLSMYIMDLNTVSLVEKIIYVDQNTGTADTSLEFDDCKVSAGFEICDGIVFSDLRDVRICIDSIGYSWICGVKKESGGYGSIILFDPILAGGSVFPEPGFEIYKCVLAGIIGAAALFGAALLITLAIRRILSARRVIFKQIILSLAVISVSCVFIHLFMLSQVRNLVYSNITTLLTSTLDYIRLSIDGDTFRDSGLTDEQRELCRNYENRSAARIIDRSDYVSRYITTDFKVSFIEVARNTSAGYKYEFYSKQLAGASVSYFITDEGQMAELTKLDRGENMISGMTEYNREWLEATCAVTDSAGKQTGFIQIGSEVGGLNIEIHRFAGIMTIFVMILIAVISALFLVIMGGLLRPLKKLKSAVSEVADGRIGTTVAVNSNDELQDIAASFSVMSRRLEKYFKNITTISKAYEKYLPKGFFRLMGKDSVLDVKPGDHSSAELTYLFIEIEQSERLTEESSFNAFNSIYGIVSDVLSVTGGTVQSFSDKMITCIFSSGASEAAETALTIEEKLAGRADIKSRITVSIQKSRSVIGVIGSGEAMKTITVSDAIELQSCLSIIISRFRLTFIVTQRVLSELKAAGLNISARQLGTVNFLLGYETRFDELLFEIIDGCPDEEKKLRQATLRYYNLALEAAARGDTSSERAQLIGVLRVNRNDLAARYMLEKISGGSEENVYEPGTEDRNGLEIST